MGGFCGLVAAELMPIMPARYVATTQILIEPTDLRVVDKSVIDSTRLSDTANSQVESQTRILVSRSVLARVVDQQNLIADAEFNGRQPGILDSAIGFVVKAFASPPRPNGDIAVATVDNLQRHLKVERLPQSFVVELSVSTRNAKKSAHLANAVAQAYLDEQAAAQAATARRASEALSSRLSSLAESAHAAEEKVQLFKQKNQIVVATGQVMTEAQAADLNNQLALARARTTAAKARYEQAKKMLEPGFDAGDLSESVQSPTITRLREQYASAARHEAALAGSLGPQHPDLIQARSDLAKAGTLVSEEITRIARSSENDYQRALADEASLAKTLQDAKDAVMKANDSAVGLHELERDAEAKRSVYEALAVRSRELGEQEWIDTSNIRVISAATTPINRSFPPPTLLVLSAAFVLGCGAGGARAVLLDASGGRLNPGNKQIFASS